MFRRSGFSPKDTILKQIKVRNKEQYQKPSQKGSMGKQGYNPHDNLKNHTEWKYHAYTHNW